MKFDVYFEIYGKKLKVTIEADREIDAKIKVREAIKFFKIVPESSGMDFLTDLFNGFDK